MDLNYSDDQQMLRESAERFLREQYDFALFSAKRQAGVATDRAIWKRFADLGWLALPISEGHGGLGGGPIEVAILTEMMGRFMVLEPFVPVAVLAGGLIDRLGTEAQRLMLLDPLIAGEAWTVLAHDERGGLDLAAIDTTAIAEGSGFRLSGTKVAVLGATGADHLLVTARLARTNTDRDIGIFIVPRDTPGLEVRPFRTAEGGEAADLALSDVAVSADALLGGERSAASALALALDQAAVAQCWDAVGAMDALLAATVSFLKERVQFGRPLSTLQALRHRCAEMAVKCTEARAIALLASLSLDAADEPRLRGVSAAKSKIGRISRPVAQEAIQLHGAMGFSSELAVGWWFKRLFLFEMVYGSTSEHLARYGSLTRDPSVQAASLLRAPSA